MRLTEVVEQVLPSVVALGSRLVPSKSETAPLFPLIFGTGFVVDRRGIVATNHHVWEELEKIPPPARLAILFPPPQQHKDGSLVGILLRGIRSVALLGEFRPRQPYYGPELPDIAFLQIDVCDLPCLELNRKPNVLRAGEGVATAGFPLGQMPLTLHQKITQISPFVRSGIISSVYPAPSPYPDGFTMDITIQGGTSGSPVFLSESGLVVRMIYALVVDAPNIALAVPSNMIAIGLESALSKGSPDLKDVPTWQSLLDSPGELTLAWDSLGDHR